MKRLVIPVFCAAAVGVLCLGLCGAFFSRIVGHYPGGPATSWLLPDGTMVRFYKLEHDPPGRDSIKVLEVARPHQPTRAYQFAIWHAGYSFVELRANNKRNLIWIVDTRSETVGCSLDLDSGRFTDEHGSHPPAVGPSNGTVIRPSG